MSFFAKLVESPIAEAGGVDSPAHPGEDPYQALDDLMAVVELLCPVWPPREASHAAVRLLL
jgi:hypothetical protein